MRNIIITLPVIVYLLIGLDLSAQEYYPLALEGAHWVEGIENESGMGGLESIWEHHIDGDTIINGENYKKVYRRALLLNENQAPPFEGAEPYYLVAVIRDDIENKKVYAIVLEDYINGSCPLNEEYVLYDFSLYINDPIDFCTYQGYGDDILMDISETDYQGVDSRAFVSNTQHFYYEGVGGVNGLFEGVFSPMKKSLSIPYPQLYYYCPNNVCDIILSSPDILYSQKLLIFPNPAVDHIIFTTVNMDYSKIRIFSIDGDLVTELSSNNSQVQWNCQDQAAGIYFYQVEIEGQIQTGKIVVQH